MGNPTIKIGELLVKAGAMTPELVKQRLVLAKQLGLPLGQIIVQSKDVNREELMAVLQFQSLYMEGLISMELLATAVKSICRQHLSLEQALAQAGLTARHDSLAYRLGDLLKAADLINRKQLAWALLTSGESAVPLGHALVQTGAVKPEIVAAALTAQRQIRQGTVSSAEAIELLQSLPTRRKPVDRAKTTVGLARRGGRR